MTATVVPSKRQSIVLGALTVLEAEGYTWKELAEDHGWHHGQASGVLSTLHQSGKVARLVERRDRCAVYVLPQYVEGRATAPYGNRVNWKERALAAEWQLAAHMATHDLPS